MSRIEKVDPTFNLHILRRWNGLSEGIAFFFAQALPAAFAQSSQQNGNAKHKEHNHHQRRWFIKLNHESKKNARSHKQIA